MSESTRWLSCAALLLAGFGALYLFNRRLLGHRVALRHTLVTAVLCALLAIPAAVVWCLIPASWRDPWGVAWRLAFSLLASMTAFLGYPARRTRAGPVLVDLGKNARHRLWLVAGLLLLITSLGPLYRGLSDPGARAHEWATALLRISGGLMAVRYGLSGVQVREEGVLSFALFVPWHRIESYGWEPGSSNTLTMRVRGRPALFRETSVAVPGQYRGEVEDLLRRYVVSGR
jgi:hypothetical protein